MFTPPIHTNTTTASQNAAGRTFLDTTRFDLIISLGENCGCALYLRELGLRSAAFPFDWLTGAPFKKRIELILDDFHGFLEKDNLQKRNAVCKHDVYKDKNTGFVSPHDFNEGAILERAYPEVIKKYQRRIKRLYSAAGEAEHTLFIWWGYSGENISDEDIIDAQKRLSQKFNKNIYLLMIQNNSVDDNIEEICLGRYIIKITGPIKNNGDIKGNISVGNEIFSRIAKTKQRRIKIYRKCKKILIQIGCGFIPGKSLRDTLRARLKQEILGDDL